MADKYTGSELQLDVPPTQVRLRPKPEELYTWEVQPAKGHLFQKGMSKLSVGSYMELVAGLGTFFRVVLNTSEARSPYTQSSEELDNLRA